MTRAAIAFPAAIFLFACPGVDEIAHASGCVGAGCSASEVCLALSCKWNDASLSSLTVTPGAIGFSSSQNREGHPNFAAYLHGRIGYVCMVDRDKGVKLRGKTAAQSA